MTSPAPMPPSGPQPGAPRISPDEFRQRAQLIEAEVANVIVGQRDLIRQVVVVLLAGGPWPT
jgi:MoxR-like ATPase